MRTFSFLGILTVLLAATFYSSNAEKTAFLSGKSECLDCAEKNVKNELAYQGLQVLMKCKTSSGDYETKGTSKLRDDGKYNIQLPAKLIGDSEAGECFAELHSVSNALCPHIKNEPNPSKIILDFKDDGVRAFSTSSKLPFSISTCTAAFLCFPPKKFYFPPIYKKPCPPSIPIYKPPVPSYKPVPIYKPPVPSYKPVPIYKPPVPSYKPVPIYKPPVPIYKPPVPSYKPVPIYKPPVPSYKPVPIYKPSVPIYKPPVPSYKPIPIYKPVPIYKPSVPIYKKPCPPLTPVPFVKPFPPIYKKPTHPLLKFPPIYKKPLPHFPKFPPIYKKPLPHFTKYPPMHKKPLPLHAK